MTFRPRQDCQRRPTEKNKECHPATKQLQRRTCQVRPLEYLIERASQNEREIRRFFQRCRCNHKLPHFPFHVEAHGDREIRAPLAVVTPRTKLTFIYRFDVCFSLPSLDGLNQRCVILPCLISITLGPF